MAGAASLSCGFWWKSNQRLPWSAGRLAMLALHVVPWKTPRYNGARNTGEPRYAGGAYYVNQPAQLY
ncbi:hypothetical protein KCP76_17200 [Salmonella enterica subsp. enterica serovar Weltevreden]|nr:hypothetical protein KCP76_17200 [Salmonella enterica subsp. enterica serovar Weltevreden]